MITAIILAAGQSRRMGQPKMALPWGETTVLGKVIATFRAAQVEDILIVTGGDREQVEQFVGESARMVFNPQYARGEMLSSVQAGLVGLAPESEAALVALGDQPQVRESSVRSVLEQYRETGAALVVPSFQRRRGHPWLVARTFWEEILSMRAPATLRDFLNRHAQDIRYVEIEDASILQDLDTPRDYLKSKP